MCTILYFLCDHWTVVVFPSSDGVLFVWDSKEIETKTDKQTDVGHGHTDIGEFL